MVRDPCCVSLGSGSTVCWKLLWGSHPVQLIVTADHGGEMRAHDIAVLYDSTYDDNKK